MRLERFRALGGAAGGGSHQIWLGMGPPTMGSIFRQGEKKMMQNDLLTLTPQGGGDPGRAEGLY